MPTIPSPPRHRQTLDVVLFHQTHDIFERRIFRDGEWLLRHDLADLAPLLAHEIACSGTGAQQKRQPPAVLSLRTDLRASDEIAFRDDADQLSAGIEHRKSADVVLQHGRGGFDDRGIRPDRYDLPGHDLMCAH